MIRADGERAICRLADALAHQQAYQDIPSLCFKDGGAIQCNEIGDLLNDVDGYGIPVINSKGACYIEDLWLFLFCASIKNPLPRPASAI